MRWWLLPWGGWAGRVAYATGRTGGMKGRGDCASALQKCGYVAMSLRHDPSRDREMTGGGVSMEAGVMESTILGHAECLVG